MIQHNPADEPVGDEPDEKVAAETRKLNAEAAKLEAEARDLNRKPWERPSAWLGAGSGVAALIAALLVIPRGYLDRTKLVEDQEQQIAHQDEQLSQTKSETAQAKTELAEANRMTEEFRITQLQARAADLTAKNDQAAKSLSDIQGALAKAKNDLSHEKDRANIAEKARDDVEKENYQLQIELAASRGQATSQSAQQLSAVLTTTTQGEASCESLLMAGFRNDQLKLMSEKDVLKTASDLGAEVPALLALLHTETVGPGFLDDGRPKILFERQLFSKLTAGKFDGDYPDISNSAAGGYGPSGAGQYDRLARAASLNCHAALLSTSWGLGQMLGSQFATAGFGSVEDFVAAQMASESRQLAAIAGFLKQDNLATPLREKNWPKFAAGYNGASYSLNHYDILLAQGYDYYRTNPMPDYTLRAAQYALERIGFNPNGVDGYAGPATVAAIRNFQTSRNLVPDGILAGRTKELLVGNLLD